MNIGIVGHEAAKFTTVGKIMAEHVIESILCGEYGDPPIAGATLVSGGCHLGGVDIWAEETAARLGMPAAIFRPETHSWETGYKPRNLAIAAHSDIVHVVVVDKLPPEFKGMTHPFCYHCNTNEHVKSGGCWTANQARRQGKQTVWHIIRQKP